jgi:hypothetical protein
MKIAFVEWYPRICGVTEVTKHWVTGAAALGYQGDLVTFSKTGRPRGDWHDAAAWRCHRIADLPEVLNAYDLVVLSDLICQAPQVCGGRSKKNWVEPYFVEALRHVATPWTTMLHDGSYHAKHEATIEKMLALRNFAGTVITSRPTMVKERFAKYLDKFKLVYYPYLPYDFASRTPFTGRRTKDFIMTSRIATTKGQNTALQLLPDLKGDVHVWGITAFGLPSLAWGMLWEFGVALGYQQQKFPVPAQRLLAKAKGPVHPNAHKFYTGAFEFRANGRRYVYHDDFPTQDDIDWAPWISLSLTNDSLQESLEVVTLDAVAKGAVAVVPDGQFKNSGHGKTYESLFTLPYDGANWRVKDGKVVETRSDWNRPAVVEKLNWLLKQTNTTLDGWQQQQRIELADRHAPKKVLKCLLEAL